MPVPNLVKEFVPSFAPPESDRDASPDSMIAALAKSFPDVVRAMWINCSSPWCADAWIPSCSAIVEYDGSYWHGLDRSNSFTLDQITSLAGDLEKARLVVDERLTLVRIKEGTDVSTARSLNDLIAASYFAIVGGKVVKGSAFAIDEEMPIHSREQLLTGPGPEWRTKELLPAIQRLFRAHVSFHGWFYPSWDSEALRTILKGNESDRSSSIWLKSFVRSFWDVDHGPAQAFEDDKVLMRVLMYRLGLNNSKPYTYVLSSGESITTRETFDINLKNVRRGFVVQRNAVSWFKPSIAREVYEKHLKGIERPVVWDPSIGFSARLLGFAMAFPTGTYVGTDPAVPMYDDAGRLSELLAPLLPEFRTQLHNTGSEKFLPEKESLDFVFTSPPYFDLEQYFDEPGQCWRDYSTLEAWTHSYLTKTFENAFHGLKCGAKMVINISTTLDEVAIAVARSVGFELTENVLVENRHDHFARKASKKAPTTDSYLTFTKAV
jgi:hypothetical protein